MSDLFSRAAHWTGQQCGRASVFMVAVGVIIAWAVTGPLFHYSDTWQLIINTGTTIVTFLMVFLLQNTQNRDTAAIQLKLDELIRANRDARNTMFGLEDLSEEELKKVKATFASLADAPAAAGRVRMATEQLRDASDALRSAARSTEFGSGDIANTCAAHIGSRNRCCSGDGFHGRGRRRLSRPLLLEMPSPSYASRTVPPRRSAISSSAWRWLSVVCSSVELQVERGMLACHRRHSSCELAESSHVDILPLR